MANTPLNEKQVLAEDLKKRIAPEFIEVEVEDDEEEKIEKIEEKKAPRRYYGCGR